MEELEAIYLIPKPLQLENYEGDQCRILVNNTCATLKQLRQLEHDQPKGPKHVPRKVNKLCSVEFRPFAEDPKLEAKITEIQNLINKLAHDKIQIIKELDELMGVRRDIFFALGELNYRERRTRNLIAQNWIEKDIALLFLDKLRFANNNHGGKPAKSGISREELVQHKLHYRVLHRTANLAEENQLFREIKAGQRNEDVNSCLSSLDDSVSLIDSHEFSNRQYHRPSEKTHRKAAKNRLQEIMTWRRKATVGEDIVLGNICNSMSLNRKAVRDQVKVLSTELDELREKKPRSGAKVGRLKGELKRAEKEMNSLGNQLHDIMERRKEAYQCFLQLMKQPIG